jgi:hypothetical protein
MNRSLKVLAVVLVVLFCAGAVFAQSGDKKAAWPAYPLSILLGFGTGQFYQGENGVGFLIADVAGYGGIIGGAVYMMVAVASAAFNPLSVTSISDLATATLVGYTIIGVGSVVWLVSRIWEVVDTFGTVDRLSKAGQLAGLTPTIDVRPTGVSFGLSYKL